MFHYYMFNKPFGCVTARRDSLYPTVMDYFSELNNDNLNPVGRLDRETTGLSVMTSGRSCVKKGKPRFWSPTISPKPSACLIGSSSSRKPLPASGARFLFLLFLLTELPCRCEMPPNSSNIFNRSGRS